MPLALCCSKKKAQTFANRRAVRGRIEYFPQNVRQVWVPVPSCPMPGYRFVGNGRFGCGRDALGGAERKNRAGGSMQLAGCDRRGLAVMEGLSAGLAVRRNGFGSRRSCNGLAMSSRGRSGDSVGEDARKVAEVKRVMEGG